MSATLPTTLPVRAVVRENYRTVSLVFANKLGTILPGQFVMLWLPGVNEKPVSVGYADADQILLTVSAVGPWSEAVQRVAVGDRLGLRGPFGTAFRLPTTVPAGQKLVGVGGGFGVAPLHFLAHAARAAGLPLTVIVGARNEAELLYRQRLAEVAEVNVTTDDGSVGQKGFTTAALAELLTAQKVAGIFSCGPEVMMQRVGQMAADAGVPCQLSLERYMKCGFGICGSCCLDGSGRRVCVDGPVVTAAEALAEAEFGHYHRSGSGQRV